MFFVLYDKSSSVWFTLQRMFKDQSTENCMVNTIVIIIITTMFMVLSSWQSRYESSPGRRPKTEADDLGCESACTGCQKLHPPSPFIITQPESWYSFYRPTEGSRLSRPSWLVTYRDGLPVHRRSPICRSANVDRGQRVTTKPHRQLWLL